MQYAKLADEVISWIRSKTLMHHKVKVTHGMLIGQKEGKSVLRAVITRWTSNFLAYCRLSELQLALRNVISQDRMLPENARVVIFGDSSAKKKAESMILVVENPQFWTALDRYVCIKKYKV